MAQRPASPMRGRYLVRNTPLNVAFRLADAVLGAAPARRPPMPRDPQRILIGVGGHLGDAIIATSAVADIHELFPRAELAIATPSWNRVVFERHSYIARIHAVDHWSIDRSQGSRVAKASRYYAAATRAARELRSHGYDVALDLYPYFPNMAAVFRRSGIPVRIGYTSGGLGELYTHAVDWVDDRAHTTAKQRRLVDMLASGRTPNRQPSYDLGPIPAEARARVGALLGDVVDGKRIVLHAGAGVPQKAWPVEKWISLARELVGAGYAVLLTGAGSRDRAIAAEIAAAVPACTDLVNQLDWPEFIDVVGHANLLVSGDTSAAHVAAGLGVSQITLYTGMADSGEFRPLSDRGVVLMTPVPCAPCFQGAGCASMSCIRDIEPRQVFHAAMEILNKR